MYQKKANERGADCGLTQRFPGAEKLVQYLTVLAIIARSH